MKHIVTYIIIFTTLFSWAQQDNKAQLLAMKKANNYVYEGNEKLSSEDIVSAEMAYRKAISEQPTSVAGVYNLANAYIKNGNFEEALYRLEQAVKSATTKEEKHKAFHNIGNVLMQSEQCKEAVEAYKNALRNNPSDDETRYNLAVAKACAEEQKQQDDQNQDQDNQDENKDNEDQKDQEDNQDQEGDNKDDQNDQGDEDKKDSDKEKDDEGKPEDDKKDEGKDKEDKQPQPQPGQLSPQQIKNLLEAMNNQEQQVQEKINAEKQKGVKVKSAKDW
ncbi:tetratricopeptide repeat protein [Tamlana fucoidanivorans]|uniref:Tetratricopeptide repeat protein n=1 Tax=Allotamlana fucoidanivorans TaxID=2583814 RepID=A0A5C4SUA9_9FLAO|nr:tetratricopeptide repeat protein [Tamlana fucoidanivorans]TNJ47201.1 tetratricopeptide repeat protein [Tamlana fucoidanivorans]